MTTQTYTGTLAVISCATCHMDFGITSEFSNDRREDHRNFYCPVGHTNHYPGKSDIEKAEERARRAERDAEFARRRAANADDRAAHADRRRAAAKGQLTKAKKRIANGVCPCCNRTFVDLARHMSSQHPDFGSES